MSCNELCALVIAGVSFNCSFFVYTAVLLCIQLRTIGKEAFQLMA